MPDTSGWLLRWQSFPGAGRAFFPVPDVHQATTVYIAQRVALVSVKKQQGIMSQFQGVVIFRSRQSQTGLRFTCTHGLWQYAGPRLIEKFVIMLNAPLARWDVVDLSGAPIQPILFDIRDKCVASVKGFGWC